MGIALLLVILRYSVAALVILTLVIQTQAQQIHHRRPLPLLHRPLLIQQSTLEPQTFHIGTIPVNGSAEINPVVYPTASSGETVQNLNLQISYGDAYGNQQTSNVPVGLVILPNPPLICRECYCK